MYQPSMEWYTRHHCPKCAAVNWTHHGHSLDDDTTGDTEVCQCWNCHTAYWLMDKELADDIHGGDMDGACSQKGRSHP